MSRGAVMFADAAAEWLRDLERRRNAPPSSPVDGAYLAQLRANRHLSVDHLYAYRKWLWIATHPGATPSEYEAAVRRICDELGY